MLNCLKSLTILVKANRVEAQLYTAIREYYYFVVINTITNGLESDWVDDNNHGMHQDCVLRREQKNRHFSQW